MSRKLIFSLFLAIFALTLNVFASSKGPGDKIENFSIVNYDGANYSLSDALASSKSGVIIMFWSTVCPNVQPYNDRINDYVKEYTEKGFTVWAINSNYTESNDEVKAHAEKNSYVFPVLKDMNNVVADMFGATRTPEVFVIGKDNTILYHGRITDNRSAAEQKTTDLKNAVDEISQGKEVTVKETKSFGCGIKRVEK
ncbi:MAG: redoxin domain-containing protein [Ignavibacteria bacterium]|nr:redoxin domain-containing protein [Ignavibacteria bacterium]